MWVVVQRRQGLVHTETEAAERSATPLPGVRLAWLLRGLQRGAIHHHVQ